MKTQNKCRMKINLFSKRCVSVLWLTIPPGRRSGKKKSLLCSCIHLWNGLMSVHHLNQSRMFVMDADLPNIWWEEPGRIEERREKMWSVKDEEVEEEWMITLSCFNLGYSPSFHHSIPHHPFVFLFMSPCLVLFLSFCSTSSSLPYVPSPTPRLSKTAGGTLRSAKLPRLHNHWWNGWQWVHCSAGHLSSW